MMCGGGWSSNNVIQVACNSARALHCAARATKIGVNDFFQIYPTKGFRKVGQFARVERSTLADLHGMASRITEGWTRAALKQTAIKTVVDNVPALKAVKYGVYFWALREARQGFELV
jgi:hypothetical protein